jgi:AcrR family transcriptional regulator
MVKNNVASRRSRQSAAESQACIIDAASVLFAEHGYHGVTTRQIASAAGLNIGTVHHHLGTKLSVYRAVYARLFDEEERLLAAMESRFRDEDAHSPEAFRDFILALVDDYLAFVAQNPLRARLYMRHWLESDAKMRTFEAERALALYHTFNRLLQRAQAAGVIAWRADPGILLRSVDWMVYGYFVSGAFDWQAWRADPQAPQHFAAFRALIGQFVTTMLRLPEA